MVLPVHSPISKLSVALISFSGGCERLSCITRLGSDSFEGVCPSPEHISLLNAWFRSIKINIYKWTVNNVASHRTSAHVHYE